MDCNKLHQDIAKLKEYYNSLSSALESATETGKGKSTISDQLQEAITTEDQILESYLPDFSKQNPELLQLDLGNRIECKDADSDPAHINSIAPLPDGSIMIGGDSGTLYRATVDKDGNLDLGNRIECKNTYSDSTSIYSITPLPDGSIMIGGNYGTLYRATVDKDGKLDLGNRIECKDADSGPAPISSIAPLSDGSIMIGGDSGALYRATLTQPTLEHLKGHLDDISAKKDS